MKKFLIALVVVALCATDALAGCRHGVFARFRERHHVFGHPAGTISGCGSTGCSMK